MIGKPNDALAPTLAYVCRKSWMRTSSKPARLLTRSHVLSIAPLGFVRDALSIELTKLGKANCLTSRLSFVGRVDSLRDLT